VATLSTPSSDPLVAIAAADSLRSLDPARLDPAAMRARRWLIERGGIELRELLREATTHRARRPGSPFVSVLHVDDLGVVDWHAARTHAPVTPGLIVKGDTIIVSLLNPAKLRAAVIPAGAGEVQVSAEFGAFAAICDPYAVIGLLHAEPVRAQLRPLGTGTSSSRRRIDSDEILSLIVPKLTGAALDGLGQEVRLAVAQIEAGRDRLWRQFEAAGS
jgi:hypothetical protein